MPEINLFLDSSALMAGIVSAGGAARALLILAESGLITITISEQVVSETERAIARKAPKALGDFRRTILASKAKIVHDPPLQDVLEHAHLISHAADVPILVAAMHAQVDYLVTLNRRHFIDDPGVSAGAGIRIRTPGDALIWVRGKIVKGE